MPVIGCDYGFLKMEERAPLITVLVASDMAYKQVGAILFEHKGLQDQFVARCLAGHIRFLGMPKISLRGDACETVPGSSPCEARNGLAERALLTVQGTASRRGLARLRHLDVRFL